MLSIILIYPFFSRINEGEKLIQPSFPSINQRTGMVLFQTACGSLNLLIEVKMVPSFSARLDTATSYSPGIKS